jgi:HK97 family phage portal protein
MLQRFKKSITNIARRWTLNSTDSGWLNLWGAGPTQSGVTVTTEKSIQLATVYACINKISSSIAQLPLNLMYATKKNNQRFDNKAETHGLYRVLKKSWNPLMTSFEARRMMQALVCLHGNAVAEIQRNNAGQVIALWPWPPSAVRYEVNGFVIRYFFVTDKGEKEIPAENIFHLRGLVLSGALGLSPIMACRECFGEAFAVEQFSNRFFKNNARPGGVLEFDGNWSSKDAQTRFEASWKKMYSGENLHSTAVLPKGMKYTPFAISQEDAQFIETRKFSQLQIASIFDVPPHMIGNMDDANYSNIEMKSREYVDHSLAPWMVNWEQRLDHDLLTPTEQKYLYAKHNVGALLRGDTKTRWQAHQVAFRIGAKSPNEIREQEDWNPREDGDHYFTEMNLDRDDQADEDETETENDNAKNAQAKK